MIEWGFSQKNGKQQAGNCLNDVKILFLVYHDLSTEERSKEIAEVLTNIGETTIVSITKKLNLHLFKNYYAKQNYLLFIFISLRKIMLNEYNIIVLHDNYCAPLLLFCWLKRNAYIIYDSSEYYPIFDILKIKYKSIKHRLFDFVLRLFERIFLPIFNPNMYIAPNIERMKSATEYFHIRTVQYIYDNVHKINDDSIKNLEIEKIIKSDEKKNIFKIMYAGGINKDRETYNICNAVQRLGCQYMLIIAGSASEKDKKTFLSNNYTNCIYIGFISRGELKYLYENTDVGVTAFKKNTLNNTYCASGKIYECLFIGKPIICSNNPPLARLCSEYHVGIASDNYYKSIQAIKNDYNSYRESAIEFSMMYPYDDRLTRLKNFIVNAYKLYLLKEKK
jgi:hypothetical protein